MTISAKLQKIYSVAPDGQYYVEALSLEHSALKSTIHITNNPVGFTGMAGPNVVSFLSLPFSLTLPSKDTSGSQQMKIGFSNVEQDLISDIERMASQPYAPCICSYRVFIIGQVNAAGNHIEQLKPAWKMDISTFAVTSDSIAAVAEKVKLHNKPFPSVLYNSSRFPGLDI